MTGNLWNPAGSDAVEPNADRTSSLLPVDEDSVFDPMSDMASTPVTAALASNSTLNNTHSSALEDSSNAHRHFDHTIDESDTAVDYDSVSGVADSPAESSFMPSGSHPDSYSLSSDLMSRLTLEQPLNNRSDGVVGTPDSMVAMGSAPSTTLSDFSAVGTPGGSAQKEGPPNRRARRSGKSNFSSHRCS